MTTAKPRKGSAAQLTQELDALKAAAAQKEMQTAKVLTTLFERLGVAFTPDIADFIVYQSAPTAFEPDRVVPTGAEPMIDGTPAPKVLEGAVRELLSQSLSKPQIERLRRADVAKRLQSQYGLSAAAAVAYVDELARKPKAA